MMFVTGLSRTINIPNDLKSEIILVSFNIILVSLLVKRIALILFIKNVISTHKVSLFGK